MPLNLPSIALHTDLYQLTMAQGYWKLGIHNRQAIFDLSFRELPFQGGYAVACGLTDVVDVIENYAFSSTDLEFLASLPAADGTPLFEADFLAALSSLRLAIHLDAFEEGTPIFPKEPLLRVRGPLWQCQLLETILLNIINFSTLIATKAARVCYAAGSDSVLEFGLRRAQGPNGGLMATRSAFVGGVSASSNVLAGQQYGIALRGTHAHSWVMAFDSEQEAFEAYAKVMPNNGIFLVDTYQTVAGVERAIAVGKKLQASGQPFLGIRLDSGDLAALSIAARKRLDEAGFTETKIVASSDLDEYVIEKLKREGAKIDVWGVGTRLVTGYDQPALGGVYKLVAIQDAKGVWQNRAKKTDTVEKGTVLGLFGVRRVANKTAFLRDEFYPIEHAEQIDPVGQIDQSKAKMAKVKTVEGNIEAKELLLPIFRDGKRVYSMPTLVEIQKHCQAQLEKLPAAVKTLLPSQAYPIEWLNQTKLDADSRKKHEH